VRTRTHAKRIVLGPLLLAAALLAPGCGAQYVTPGAGVNLAAISDSDIRARFGTYPASPFPARLAIARVQQAGYYSHGNTSYGRGAFSVVTTRDIERDEHFETLAALPQVVGLGRISRLLLSEDLQSVKDLRLAAATLHADLLLVYTLDTSFRIRGQSLGPLTVVTLGFLPSKKATVTATASAVLFDVRTGHVYGLAEASHAASHLASTWTKEQAIDKARLDAETEAFAKLIDEFRGTWNGVLKEYAGKDPPSGMEASRVLNGAKYETTVPE